MMHRLDSVDCNCLRLAGSRALWLLELSSAVELVDELKNSRSRSAVPLSSTRVENSTVAEHDSPVQLVRVLTLVQPGDDVTAALNDLRNLPRLNIHLIDSFFE